MKTTMFVLVLVLLCGSVRASIIEVGGKITTVGDGPSAAYDACFTVWADDPLCLDVHPKPPWYGNSVKVGDKWTGKIDTEYLGVPVVTELMINREPLWWFDLNDPGETAMGFPIWMRDGGDGYYYYTSGAMSIALDVLDTYPSVGLAINNPWGTHADYYVAGSLEVLDAKRGKVRGGRGLSQHLSVIPEPSTLAIFLVGSILLTLGRRML